MTTRIRAALLASAALAAAPALALAAPSCDGAAALCTEGSEGQFALIANGMPTAIHADAEDHSGVRVAVENLRGDLASVAGREGALAIGAVPREGMPVIIGSLDASPMIQKLVSDGKLDTDGVEGVWEAYSIQTVEDPFPGVERALVVMGADERGTIYGAYDLSERAGVSPWHYWADVPAEKHATLTVTEGRRVEAPSVKYRGIFLNDEEPALGNFARETFGGINADFYEKVFDLILRSKGNYLWPAMWGKAFYDDDPKNPQLADKMGVVIGTSHHEPLMRAHVEWERYGEGDWNYQTNAEALRTFWRGGMERMGDEEALVTVGMRGDGDEAMTEGTAIDLLETIVADQREIIAEVTGKPAAETPQVWALYKEVQDYYDQGMEVPDDVTLLFADDNWGNIRRLPEMGAERPGGYGVYYHFDYVGGPRNYKWLNTTQIERAWQQMDVAWDRGADRIWIVNVGDLKPMEFPISFFLDQAWDPEAMTVERVDTYARDWAAEQFGEEHADEIGELLETYTKYNARRKPELLDADTYDAASGEWARVAGDYDELAKRADVLREEMPEGYDDAFVQLVWFPIQASANLYDLYYAVAMNRMLAEQGRPSANEWADRAEAAYARDAELTRLYHEDVAGGKWDHMMSQTHIGYTYWQQPEEQTMPEVTRVDAEGEDALKVAVQGNAGTYGAGEDARLPMMTEGGGPVRFTLFTTGTDELRYRIRPSERAVKVSTKRGRLSGEETVEVTVDWDRVDEGSTEALIAVDGPDDQDLTLTLPLYKAAEDAAGFVMAGGAVSMGAASASCTADAGALSWLTVPNLGRTDDAVAVVPADAEPAAPGEGPRMDYVFTTTEGGEATLTATLFPTLDPDGGEGLRYAVSLNGGEPQTVTLGTTPDEAEWGQAVSDYAHKATTRLGRIEPGTHTLSLYAVDPGIVVQHLTVATGETGETPEMYLGLPESPMAGTPDCGTAAD
ncbi:glycosyl hydrolase 115 family protein [Parvularcula dongshanensis]|uniref:Gylcosyl hydrolase 115 C-terminal domain-containing protein n=1 Tax=Parvularcula dongshanensis TaxID=1173995 RepID=A0A840I7J6_9PROT|nr:glycosyl hydrolase 115 family protein [Parvularcula dongshanensis]MBB4659930.1 hypothetical protein [Parvularcula dongshanensis]